MCGLESGDALVLSGSPRTEGQLRPHDQRTRRPGSRRRSCPPTSPGVTASTVESTGVAGRFAQTSVLGGCRVKTLATRLQRCHRRPDPGAQRRRSGMLISRAKRNCRSSVAALLDPAYFTCRRMGPRPVAAHDHGPGTHATLVAACGRVTAHRAVTPASRFRCRVRLDAPEEMVRQDAPYSAEEHPPYFDVRFFQNSSAHSSARFRTSLLTVLLVRIDV
jgi:hypothetical protein